MNVYIHFLNGISEINQLFDDILIIWPAPVYIYSMYIYVMNPASVAPPDRHQRSPSP